MTRPGPPPPRGRHSAPDGDARPDQAVPGGRHAAPDPPQQRHAAPEQSGSAPPPRRRHAAPDDSPYGVPDAAPNGVTYHRPILGNSLRQYRPDPYSPPNANGAGHYGPEPSPNGSPPSGAGRHRSGANGHAGSGANGTGHYGAEPSPYGYSSPRGGLGQHRSDPGPNGYAGANGIGQGAEPGPNGYGGGHRRHEPGPDGYASPGADSIGYHRPGANGARRRRAEPDAADPGADGVGYHRPGTHRYDDGELAPHPWPEANGYHLEDPAPPVVNGYRLDEPVAPVTGFPYTAPPTAPTAYPLNGHGVDAAERDAASWPVNGNAPAWPVDGQRTDLDRAPDPRIAVVPLNDEPTEVLDRPAPKPAAGKQPTPTHPPRAVVRRRRARRKALEWPFLIVFAVVSAFLIRQYVVQTFYIPSASMHETLIEGDRVLVNKVGYHLHDIHRGDVVVFQKPPNLDVSEDDLIKRVVALPGETVEGRGGKVYVNGAPLDEPYVEPLCHGTGEFAKVTVPAGALWMMGDNRCNSSDSRVFGPISQKLVVGRAFVIAWPFDRLSWL